MTVPVVDPQPFINAVKAAVAAQSVAVDVGKKPTVGVGLPWVVMWPDGGNVTNKTLRSRDGFSLLISFRCFGLSDESSVVALRKVRTAMLGLGGQVVAGRMLHLPSHVTAVPLGRDDGADPPLWQYYDEWRIRTS